MLTRRHGYLKPRLEPAPVASAQLEQDGWVVLRDVFSAGDVVALRSDLERVYATWTRDDRTAGVRDPEEDEDFRYEMFNRSALAQRAIAHPSILGVIEPLLGEDCHVIANTCWRNSPRTEQALRGGHWHVDAGRFFLQVHYGRRDVAQRVRPTSVVNHVSDAAAARAGSDRERLLLGLHPPRFYDG